MTALKHIWLSVLTFIAGSLLVDVIKTKAGSYYWFAVGIVIAILIVSAKKVWK